MQQIYNVSRSASKYHKIRHNQNSTRFQNIKYNTRIQYNIIHTGSNIIPQNTPNTTEIQSNIQNTTNTKINQT